MLNPASGGLNKTNTIAFLRLRKNNSVVNTTVSALHTCWKIYSDYPDAPTDQAITFTPTPHALSSRANIRSHSGTVRMRYLQNARKQRGLKTAVKAQGWAWREQLERFTALSSNHRQMNGHRPCFIWAGLMPGLWKHWQGQINHTSFSLSGEYWKKKERKKKRRMKDTLPPAGWTSVLFSARGVIWHYSWLCPATKTTYQNYAEKINTLGWKKPAIESGNTVLVH